MNRKKLSGTYLAIFMCCLSILPCNAQDRLWTHFNMDRGLPSSTITCFQRLADGRMAMGSSEGLLLWDGITFQKVIPQQGAGELVNPYVAAILQDPLGNVWVATRNSIWRVSLNSMSVQVYTDTLFTFGGIQSLEYVARKSSVMAMGRQFVFGFDTRASGLIPAERNHVPSGGYLYHNGLDNQTEIYRFPHRLMLADNQGKMVQLFADSQMVYATYSNQLKAWVCVSRKGIYLLKRNRKYMLNFQLDCSRLLSNNTVHTDPTGGIWISHPMGLYQFTDTSDHQGILHTGHPSNPYSIRNFNGPVWRDPDGNILLGQDGIGFAFSGAQASSLRFYRYEEIGVSTAWCFWQHPSTRLMYAGCSEGLLEINQESPSYIPRLLKPVKDSRCVVSALFPLTGDRLLVGTYGHGTWIFDLKKKVFTSLPWLKNYPVFGLKQLPGRGILLYGIKGLLLIDSVRFSIIEAFQDPLLYNLYCLEQGSGGRWYAGNGRGLLELNNEMKVLKNWRPSSLSTSIAAEVILCIKQSNSGSRYLGTMGGGLLRLVDNNVLHIPLAGNPTNIYGILETSDSSLLLSTSSGIVLYRTQNGTSACLNRKNLLPFTDLAQSGWYETQDHYWFAGDNGILSMKKPINSVFQNTSSYVIREMGLPQSNIQLKADNRQLHVEPTLLNAMPGSEAIIEYLISPAEEVMHRLPQGQAQIYYPNLSPGDYLLKVKISDTLGWMAPAILEIPVRAEARWYEQSWVKALTLLLLIALVSYAVRYVSLIRLRWKLRKMEVEDRLNRERLRISRELHDNVGSQLSYLISGLETSEMYLERQKMAEAERLLGNMQLSARESMNQLRDAIWALNRKEMDLNTLAHKLEEWLKIRASAHPQVNCSVNNLVNEKVVLDPLQSLNQFRILQEFCNNTFKYANATQLSLVAELGEAGIRWTATDNGKGFNPEEVQGNGLSIQRDRAAEIGAQLELSTAIRQGTRLVLNCKIGK